MAFNSPPTARWALAAVGGACAFEIAGRRHVTVRIHSVDGATGRTIVDETFRAAMRRVPCTL